MSCFRISVSICEIIEKECSNFWWGSEGGKNKLHWKNWKAMCKPKGIGGMGFRNLRSFNKALLVKQVWRIIKNPDSLVARVLKARYFKYHDIMESPLGSNPSFIWRSLLWSRSLLAKGLSWWVGNGEQIDIFKDQWVPRIHNCLPKTSDLGDHDLGNYATVSSFLEEGNWNSPLIHNIFPQHIAQRILAIPLLQ